MELLSDEEPMMALLVALDVADSMPCSVVLAVHVWFDCVSSALVLLQVWLPSLLVWLTSLLCDV